MPARPNESTPIADAPFPVRLDAARRLVGYGDSLRASLPLHVADQIGAAAAETMGLAPEIDRVLRVLEPERRWRRSVVPATERKAAHLVAALLGCMGAVCPHLRKGDPQPGIARLPLRRIDCRACAATVRRPPPGDFNRCDVCGTRLAVPWFFPFVLAAGAVLVMGDACSACAAVLGVGERERAS